MSPNTLHDVVQISHLLEYKAGVNGLLDVARTSYKEGNVDAAQLANDLGGIHSYSPVYCSSPAKN